MESPTISVPRNVKRTREDFELCNELVPKTDTNVFGIPDVTPYHVIVHKGKTPNDVIDDLDEDNVRKFVQLLLSYHTGKKTANIYITYDEQDAAYEITTIYPKEVPIEAQMFNDLVRLHPLILVKRPYAIPDLDPNGNPVSEVKMRVASHRRKVLNISRTILMLIETDETIHIQSDKAFERETKRMRLDTDARK